MPLSLSDLANKSARITIHYEEWSFAVEYFPKKFTFKVITLMKSGDEDAIIEHFTQLIKSWELYDDTEQTIMTPITAKRLKEFPVDLLVHIMDVIFKEIRPELKASQMNGAH